MKNKTLQSRQTRASTRRLRLVLSRIWRSMRRRGGGDFPDWMIFIPNPRPSDPRDPKP